MIRSKSSNQPFKKFLASPAWTTNCRSALPARTRAKLNSNELHQNFRKGQSGFLDVKQTNGRTGLNEIRKYENKNNSSSGLGSGDGDQRERFHLFHFRSSR